VFVFGVEATFLGFWRGVWMDEGPVPLISWTGITGFNTKSTCGSFERALWILALGFMIAILDNILWSFCPGMSCSPWTCQERWPWWSLKGTWNVWVEPGDLKEALIEGTISDSCCLRREVTDESSFPIKVEAMGEKVAFWRRRGTSILIYPWGDQIDTTAHGSLFRVSILEVWESVMKFVVRRDVVEALRGNLCCSFSEAMSGAANQSNPQPRINIKTRLHFGELWCFVYSTFFPANYQLALSRTLISFNQSLFSKRGWRKGWAPKILSNEAQIRCF